MQQPPRALLGFELWLAFRLARTEKRQTGAATLAVAVAVLLVVAVQALSSGWQETLTSRLLAMVPTFTVEAEAGGCLENSELALEQARQTAGVKAVAPYSHGSALLLRGENGAPVRWRGVSWQQEAAVTRYAHYTHPEITPASLTPEKIVVGAGVAAEIDIAPGDQVELLTSTGRGSFSVAALFQTGHADLDEGFLIISLAAARQLGVDCIAGLGIATKAPPSHPSLDQLRADLQVATGHWVKPWYDGRRALLAGLALEKRIALLIGLFSVFTAAIGVGALLSLHVIQRQPIIGILAAVGAPPASIARTFFLQGLLIGVAGTASGIGLAVPLSIFLARWPIPLPAGYGLEYLPVSLSPAHIGAAGLIGIIFCGLAAIPPAFRAARLSPIAALAGR